jgi:hypothetical protein
MLEESATTSWRQRVSHDHLVRPIDRPYGPIWLPVPDHPGYTYLGQYDPALDARIERWLASARRAAEAYRRELRPTGTHFAQELADFDTFTAALPEQRQRLLWRLPSISIAINRLLDDGEGRAVVEWRRIEGRSESFPVSCDEPLLWRLFRLHLDDLAELDVMRPGFRGCWHLTCNDRSFPLLAGSFIAAATTGAP